MSDTKNAIQQLILKQVQTHNIVAYIKGTKEVPACGYSASMIRLLHECHVPFETFDVLENLMLRQVLKIYSDWPTFPQVYVKGDFIGGLDIIMEMKRDGSLDKLLEPYKIPRVSNEL